MVSKRTVRKYDRRVGPSIFSALKIPRKVPECSTKSIRYQSPTVNRVFRIAAGTTSVNGKKRLKTAERVKPGAEKNEFVNPDYVLLSRLKVRDEETPTGAKSFRCLLMARGAETNHLLVAASLHYLFVQPSYTFCQPCFVLVSILRFNSKEIR